jgi:S1-C subfamily serine protease
MSYDDYPYPTPPPRRSSPASYLVPILCLLAIAVGLWLMVSHWFGGGGAVFDPNAQPRAVEARGDLALDEKSTIELFKMASPSVVYITSVALVQDIFALNPQEIPRGTGSGFVWNEQGHIVTNYHVIHGADSAKVTLADHSTYEARLTGADPSVDLAVLKIVAPAAKLPALRVGTSSDLQVGQKVFAIGNPFGLDQTLTSGIVSALGREIKSPNGRVISGVIQTDAAINPGNSGGPLLDSAGRLIGVNTAIASPSGAYAGVGFAIPVDTVNEVVTQLIRRGAMPRPEMGIVPYDDVVARSIGVRKGVLIKRVEGAAAEAGLRPLRKVPGGFAGDVIVAINGQPVQQRSDIDKILAKAKVGETVTVTIVRDGDRSDVELQLREG